MKRLITENLPLKVISVIVALVLFLFVMQEKEGTLEITVSVNVLEQPEGHILVSDIPDLRVVLSGNTRSLSRLHLDRVSDLPLRFDAPITHLLFEPSDLSLPAGVRVESIFPDVVQLNFVRLVTDNVRIFENISTEPAPGYSVVDVQINPPSIQATGPEDVMGDLALFTRPIDITGMTETETVRVDLVSQSHYVSFDTDAVISVTIEIEVNEASFTTDVPIGLVGPTDRFSLDPEHPTQEVRLHGPRSAIDSIDVSGIAAVVRTNSYVDHEAGTIYVEPELVNLPDGLVVESQLPAQVQLYIVAEGNPVPPFLFVPIPIPGLLPIPMPTPLPDPLPVP